MSQPPSQTNQASQTSLVPVTESRLPATTTPSECESEADILTVLSFRLAGHWLGLDVASVLEIQALEHMTRVAGAPPYLKGLVNIRGEILTVLNLRPLLAVAAAEPEKSFLVLVRHQQMSLCLDVDEVGDVLYIPRQSIEPLPITVGLALREFGNGFWTGFAGGLALLDPQALLPPGFDRVAAMTLPAAESTG